MKLCYECSLLMSQLSTPTIATTTTTSLHVTDDIMNDDDGVVDDDGDLEEDPRHSLDSYMNKINDDDSDKRENGGNNNVDILDMAALDSTLNSADAAAFFMSSDCRVKQETVAAVIRPPTSKVTRQSASAVKRGALLPAVMYDCRVCLRTFISDSDLAAHLFREHADAVVSEHDALLQRFVKCPLDGCFKVFRGSDSSAAMRSHVVRSHGGEQQATAETSGGRNECLECGKVFKNVHFLRKHMAGEFSLKVGGSGAVTMYLPTG